MRNVGIWRRTGTCIPHNKCFKANKWACMADRWRQQYSDQRLHAKGVNIDDDDLSDSEESGDDYEDDFAINEK